MRLFHGGETSLKLYCSPKSNYPACSCRPLIRSPRSVRGASDRKVRTIILLLLWSKIFGGFASYLECNMQAPSRRRFSVARSWRGMRSLQIRNILCFIDNILSFCLFSMFRLDELP